MKEKWTLEEQVAALKGRVTALEAKTGTQKKDAAVVDSGTLSGCPFCGSEGCDIASDAYDWSRRNPQMYYYGECPDCETHGPVADTIEGAKELWRRRTCNAPHGEE